MSNSLSLFISFIALGVSGVTAWLTFFRRGQLAVTQPTTIFLGPDGKAFDLGKNKVHLRTLLYCTAKRGFVLESLFLSIRRNETKQNFNIWVYGQKDDLNRGSGLFVPQEGITFDHHFLLPEDGADFSFVAGSYVLTLFSKGVGQEKSTELMSINLVITDAQAKSLTEPQTGIYFDWGPDQQAYQSHVQKRPTRENDFGRLLLALGERGQRAAASSKFSAAS